MRNASHLRTLCEVLREINDLHQGDTEHDREVRRKLTEAEGMAKKMAFRLLDYNKDAFREWWDDNPEYEKRLRKRLSKKYCTGEKDGD